MGITSIGEFLNPSKLGPTLKAAHERWESIFGKLPKDKILVFEQMCSFFVNCSNAYSAFFSNADMESKERMFCVGGAAYLAVTYYNNVKKLLGVSDDKKACEAIDKTSRWLQEHGWFGLPAPYDNDGNKVYKTAWGCISDMRQFNDAMTKFVAMCHENNDRK